MITPQQRPLSPQLESSCLARLGLGPRLRALRKHARLTQAALAQRAGLHRGTVADLERGRRANVCFSTACRLSMALGLASALVLLEGSEQGLGALLLPDDELPQGRDGLPPQNHVQVVL